MFCTKCGKQIREGLKFCTNCGAPIIQSSSVPTLNTGNVNLEAVQNKNNTEDADKTEIILRKSNIDIGRGYDNRNNYYQQINNVDNNNEYSAPVYNSPNNTKQNNKKIQETNKSKKKKSNSLIIVIIITLLAIILGVAGTTVWFFGGIDMIKEAIGIESSFKSEDKSEKSKDDDKNGKDSNVKHEKPKKNKKTSKSEDNREDGNVKHEKPKKTSKSEETAESTEVTSTQINMLPTVSTDTMPTTLANNSEFILPDSDVRVLERKDIEGFTAEQCRLARNEIYARHGRLFDDAALQSYFQACSWYHGTITASNFKESMLNDVEIKNRDLILSYEKDMGYNQ